MCLKVIWTGMVTILAASADVVHTDSSIVGSRVLPAICIDHSAGGGRHRAPCRVVVTGSPAQGRGIIGRKWVSSFATR
jgi:hypothetical protein